MKKNLIISILLLAGCATTRVTSNAIYLPDGKQGYNIDCSYYYGELADPNWGDCYTEASNVCGDKGYTIIKK